MSTIVEVTSDAQVAACHPVMAQLRPHIPSEGFVARVRQLETGGYRMACVIDDGEVRAVAGYRILDQLVRGRVLYVDDLVTDEQRRSRGHGDRLLTWLYDKARASGCSFIELDSGTQRVEAHRFYARHRMIISAFHFVRPC
jgi:GNAT superfamily N-acetyltransferase